MRRVAGAVALALLAALPAAAQTAPRVEVVGTAFRVTLADGQVLAGPALAGTTLTVADANGARLPIRIEAVAADPQDAEITLYSVSVADPAAAGGRRDLCDLDPGGERWAFPLANAEGGFTLTCTSGAIGKCVRFGYKPWRAAAGGVAMRDLHAACVRMVRADYCGDGAAHTRDGTPIDIYDRAGIQRDEPAPGMRFEAAWGPQGAVCVAHTRIPALLELDALLATCPRLRAAPAGAACTDAAPGAILFDRSF